MFKNITFQWKITFFILFSWGFFLSWLYPINRSDDWLYASQGNPFYLQWLEYLITHGRFLTHTLQRITLQLGDPWMYIIKNIIVFFLLIFSVHQYNPFFWKKNNTYSFFSLALFSFFIFFFMFTIFMMFFSTSINYIFSNYLSILLVLLFFKPYISLLYNKNSISCWKIFILGILTGASHENVISLLPMLILIFIILKIKKNIIPKWFWFGVMAFLIGFLFLFLSPGSKVRLTGLVPEHLKWISDIEGVIFLKNAYGSTNEWWWFGQEINWLDLGWKRYFYSFVRHIFIALPNWYSGSGWLPTTWYIQIVNLVALFALFRKTKNIFDNQFLVPLLYYLYSWATVLVMSFSPMFHWQSIDYSRFFLYISISMALFNCAILYQWKKLYLKIFSILVFSIIFTVQFLHVPALFKSQKEYRTIISLFKEAQINDQKTVQIPPIPEARLFNQKITSYEISDPMLAYYDVESYIETNEQGDPLNK